MPRVKVRGTCANCLIDPYDSGDCPDCSGDCVRCRRVATGCFCTCVNLAFASCGHNTSFLNCGCPDGTAETMAVIDEVFIGFSIPAELIAEATLRCPDGPKIKVKIYGSHYDLATHATTTNLNCPVNTSGWDPVPLGMGFTLVDPTDGPLVTECGGGAITISAVDFDITTLPPPEGAPDGSIGCSQEGGHVALLAEFTSYCDDQLLVLCPFPGVVGAQTTCGAPPGFCERWNLTSTSQEGCDISLVFTHTAGECALTCTVTIDGVATVLDPLDGEVQTLMGTIVPCEEGAGLTVTVQREWDPACIHNCAINNGTDTFTFTA